jgi:hypothetical protein
MGAQCGDGITAPEQDGLRLEVALSTAVLQRGQVGSITMRLRNLTSQPRTITFLSTCQLNVVIRRIGGGVVFPPPPGGRACGDAITILSLAAFGEHHQIFTVRRPDDPNVAARPAILPIEGWPLDEGEYTIRAELGENGDALVLATRALRLLVRR